MLPTSFELTRTSWAPFAEVRVDVGLRAFGAGRRARRQAGRHGLGDQPARCAWPTNSRGLAGFTVAGAWGKAFKLPSLYALGHPLVGNPGPRARARRIARARACRSTCWTARRSWSATWFDGEFRNAIDFDPGPPPMLVNRNRVDTQGFELAGQLAVGEQWQLDASVTQARSRIAATGAELRNRPEWRAGAGGALDRRSPRCKLSAAATYVGSSLDSSIATGDVHLDAYTRVDVSAVVAGLAALRGLSRGRQSHRPAVRGIRGLRSARHHAARRRAVQPASVRSPARCSASAGCGRRRPMTSAPQVPHVQRLRRDRRPRRAVRMQRPCLPCALEHSRSSTQSRKRRACWRRGTRHHVRDALSRLALRTAAAVARIARLERMGLRIGCRSSCRRGPAARATFDARPGAAGCLGSAVLAQPSRSGWHETLRRQAIARMLLIGSTRRRMDRTAADSRHRLPRQVAVRSPPARVPIVAVNRMRKCRAD